jgi:hypothetical protein
MIPVYCSHCNNVFTNLGVIGGNNSTITVQDVETKCPHCGQMAKVLDGSFEIDDGVLKLLEGPWLTEEVMRQFKERIFAAARSGNIDALEEDAEAIDPRLGYVVRATKAKYTKAQVIVFVLLLLLSKTEINLSVDVNDLIKSYWTTALSDFQYKDTGVSLGQRGYQDSEPQHTSNREAKTDRESSRSLIKAHKRRLLNDIH